MEYTYPRMDNQKRTRNDKKIKQFREAHSSFMNHTKWKKIFHLLVDLELPFYEFSVKLIDENERRKVGNLIEGNPFLYINDCLIEWLFIPNQIEHRRFNRDEKLNSTFTQINLNQLVNRIDLMGKYEYEITTDGFKLYGYK